MWRRRVLQVAIPYGIGGWLLVQVAEIVLDAFEAPPWVMQGLLVILLLGFPVAVVLAWIFDITPDHHVVRTGRWADQDDQAEEAEEEPEPEPVPAMSLEMGDSERRQVTILNAEFQISHGDDPEVDPEQLRDYIAALGSVNAELAERYDAYPLPSGSEELNLVFGYPHAREDDARRAVATALTLINEIVSVPEAGPGAEDPGFTVRVGVSTGLVVVEEPGSEDGEVTIIGQAPRMASWLRGLAAPESAIIGPHTRKLVTNHFELETAGVHAQTQFGNDIEVFRVDAAVSLDGSFQQTLALKGRIDETRLLQDRWENVLDGGGQFIVLQGEPGIGKSSLLTSFVQHVHESGDITFVPCLCSPYERNIPLAPVIRALKDSILELSDQDSPESSFQKLMSWVEEQPVEADEAVPLLAGFLSLDTGGQFQPPSGSAQIVRMQTMELLLDLLSLAGAREPALLVVEDLHWADPSTLEMIHMLVDRGPAEGLFVLFSTRPGLEADWIKRSYVLVQELLPLARRSARELVESTASGIELPANLVERIIKETDGNPLFIQELTLAILESDAWRESQAAGSAEEMTWLEIPATLQDSLTARIDNLNDAKALLQLCSVLGREFRYDLLRSVSGTENESALKKELAEIVSAELLYQRGVLKNLTYTFKHILIQETAYHSLLKSKRRELHERTAGILERESPDIAKRQPALLAFHYSEARNLEKAIPFWTLASRKSLAGYANQEAIEQSRQGIKLLEKLPDSPERAAQELPLQSIRGTALLSTRGYVDPSVREAYTRAQQLCEQIGDAPQLFQVAVGLWMYHIIAGNLHEAHDLSQRLLRIAETTDNPAQDLQARYCQGFVHYYQADFLAAKSHLETALESEVPDCDYAAQSASGDDTRIHVRVVLALVNWHLGFSKTGARLLKEANAIARSAGHPYGMAFAALYGAWFHQMRNDPVETLKHASEGARIAEEKGFRFFLPLLGYMRAWSGNREAGAASRPLQAEGVEQMKTGLDFYRGVGAGAAVTYLSFKLAEDFIALGRNEPASVELEAAWQVLQTTGEDFFEPEYHRLQGRIDLAGFHNSGEAERLDAASKKFGAALTAARRMESKALELRAANDLAEVLVLQDNGAEAARLLDGILRRFDETDGAEDFTRARATLKKLK